MQDRDRDTNWGVEGLAQLFETVLDAAADQRDLSVADRDRFFRSGSAARDAGLALSSLIATYLGGAGELWEQIFSVASDPAQTIDLSRSLRKVSEQAVSSLAAGFEASQRQSIRAEVTMRTEFLDDLLTGGEPEPHMNGRADQIGFPHAASYVVLVADGSQDLADTGLVHGRVRLELTSHAPRRNLQVFTRHAQLIVVAPDGHPGDLGFVADALHTVEPIDWRVGVGARAAGLAGIATSYRQAVEVLRLTRVFGLDRFAVHDEMPAYRLMARGRDVAAELIAAVIDPLVAARRGALLETLGSFIDHCGNMAEVARDLSLGPRTVAYRLDRIAQLTGHSLRDADGRFILELAYRCLPLISAEEQPVASA